MRDTKLRLEDLTSEERAIVDGIYLILRSNCTNGTEAERYADAVRQSCDAILARRALFAPAPEKAHESAFPVGNCPSCGKLEAPYNKHAKYEGGYTCQPAQPEPAAPEMPEAVYIAANTLRASGHVTLADALLKEAWHSQPVAVGMTEERKTYTKVESLLAALRWDLDRFPGQAILHFADQIDAAEREVRQQAAQGRKAELPKVRAFLDSSCLSAWDAGIGGLHAAALAELDAAEGKERE